MVTHIGIGADRRTCGAADHRAYGSPTAAADRTANNRAGAGANDCAADSIILRTRARRSRRKRGKTRSRKNCFAHDILPVLVKQSAHQRSRGDIVP